ncbi:SH3 domain-containing protein [Echinicola sp. 20G]|uniref:SH3 domain-containing protein n=1 Tax=Echinicola sp. 20G TaxID=2781961 RepID=UPI00190FF63D|nr:SH3 domain-containing protein [Echinicola sp. 20G]
MKKLLSLIGFLLCFSYALAVDFKPGSSVFVINYQGTELKNRPNQNAKTIASLHVGDQLEIIQNTLKSADSRYFAMLKINGVWLEVKSKNGHKGYLFSGDVSNISPIVKPASDELLNIDLLGQIINTYNEINQVNLYGKQYQIESEVTQFEHCTYTVSNYDGCYSLIYSFSTLSFHEVFHQMRNMFLNYNEETGKVLFPKLIRRSESEFVFNQPGSANEVKIVLQKNGVIDIQQILCS